MKRNDIGDSYLLWLLERVLSASTQEDDPPTYAGKHSAQPSRMPTRQPFADRFADSAIIVGQRRIRSKFDVLSRVHQVAGIGSSRTDRIGSITPRYL